MNLLVSALNVKVIIHLKKTMQEALMLLQTMFRIQKITVFLAKDQTIAQSVSKSNDQASYRPLR